LAGVSRPTVDLWLSRFAAGGVSGLLDRRRGAPREQMPAAIRGRVLALTRTSPPAVTGLSHWSSRELAAFIERTEGVYVSHHYVAKLWRETGLKPHRHGTFKLSKDPEFAAKVADVVGLYLDPPGGAVVLSIDERRPRSRPWTGPSPCSRSRSTRPRSAPTTTCARHDEPVRRAERGHRRGVRRVQAHPQRGELSRLPEEGGQAAHRRGRARRTGQPVHAPGSPTSPAPERGRSSPGVSSKATCDPTSTSCSPRTPATSTNSGRRATPTMPPASHRSPNGSAGAAPGPPTSPAAGSACSA
jgi:transposase